MHGYYRKRGYMQRYASTDVDEFWIILCKFHNFFYYTPIDAVALNF